MTSTNIAKDKGHEELMRDITILYNEAKTFEFHDFKNDAYATPKVLLRSLFLMMAEKVVEGKYDN